MSVVLVVDDEEMVRKLAAMILKSAGHQVLEAGNGVEGISLYRSYSKRIDVVVTDLKMPVMDGHEMVRMIRAANPKARIVCMSGYTEQDPPEGTIFLEKPFRPDVLRETVGSLLEE